MPRTFQIKSHEVEVSTITGVHPLLAQGRVLSPDAGLTLVLDDDTKHNWLAETDGPIPAVGDFLVRDDVLHVSYTMPAEQLRTLFSEHEIRFESIGGHCVHRSPSWADTPDPAQSE